jgi:hypothetical protein
MNKKEIEIPGRCKDCQFYYPKDITDAMDYCYLLSESFNYYETEEAGEFTGKADFCKATKVIVIEE